MWKYGKAKPTKHMNENLLSFNNIRGLGYAFRLQELPFLWSFLENIVQYLRCCFNAHKVLEMI